VNTAIRFLRISSAEAISLGCKKAIPSIVRKGKENIVVHRFRGSGIKVGDGRFISNPDTPIFFSRKAMNAVHFVLIFHGRSDP